MAIDRVTPRLRHIADAIEQIYLLLDGKTLDNVMRERATQAALERFLEIISEAARHVPEETMATLPNVPWGKIKALGNILRHAYHKVETGILWSIYEDGDLAALEEAVDSLLEGPK